MDDRKNEITFVMDVVQKLCVSSQITLVAKEVKGQLMVVIKDARDGQEYYLAKSRN